MGLFALLKMQNLACSKVALSPSRLFFVITLLFLRIQAGFICIKLPLSCLFFPFPCNFRIGVLNALHYCMSAKYIV